MATGDREGLWQFPCLVLTRASMELTCKRGGYIGLECVELEHSKPLKDEDESTMDTPRNKLPTPLSYASRLNWGKNFYTASPASERLGVGHTF
eukprot:scaffold6439_cov16-Tisochrysis_lutea.AAC.1